MARVTLQFFENDANTVKVGVTDVRAEIFKSSTFCTADGTTTTTIPFANRRGFGDGDHLYIGTNASVLISDGTLPLTGAGNITVGTAISFTNNDPIIRKRDVSVDASNDDYAVVYDQEDLAQSLTQPIDLDSDHEKSVSTKAGSYGVRYFNNATGATLDVQNQVVFRWDDVRYANRYAKAGAGTTGDPWTGWEDVFANTAKVYFPAGTYLSATDWSPTSTEGFEVFGDGKSLSIIQNSNTGGAMSINMSGASDPASTRFTLRDLSFTQVTNALVSLNPMVYIIDVADCIIQNVGFYANESSDLVSNGIALQFARVSGSALVSGLSVYGSAQKWGRAIRIGLNSDVIGPISIVNGFIHGIKTAGIDIASSSTADIEGVNISGVRIQAASTAQTTPIGIKAQTTYIKSLNIHGCHIENFNRCIELTAVSGANVAGNWIGGFTAGTTPEGIYLATACQGAFIGPNVFENASSAGTGVELDASAHVGVTLLPQKMTNVATAITNATAGGSNNYIVSSTGIEVPEDDLTLTAGDLTITAGAETLTVGDLTLTAGDILVSAGTITTTAGVISAGGGHTGTGVDVTNDVRGRSIIADGDVGAGIASTAILTNATAALGGGTATLGGPPGGVATGQDVWLKIYIGGTVSYIPIWQ